MKLYYWLHDWQLPGQQHKGADKVDVPTDAAGLCAWLNARKVPICLPLHPAPQPEPEGFLIPDDEVVPTGSTFDTPPPMVLAPVADRRERQWETDSIVDFLLERATQAQVEGIFAALGCRWGEARKAGAE